MKVNGQFLTVPNKTRHGTPCLVRRLTFKVWKSSGDTKQLRRLKGVLNYILSAHVSFRARQPNISEEDALIRACNLIFDALDFARTDKRRLILFAIHKLLVTRNSAFDDD